MKELNKLQEAQIVWALITDIYNKPMLKAVAITHGNDTVRKLSNLAYKYDGIECKTLSDFIGIYDDDLSNINQELL